MKIDDRRIGAERFSGSRAVAWGVLRLSPLCWPGLWVFAAGCGVGVQAQLQVVAEREPQQVFAGEGRTVSVTWHNAAEHPVSLELRARFYQASSATAAPLGETAWKRLEMLAKQTVLESATLSFPAVKAETRFLVQWIEGTNRVAGTTEVLVYPKDLLKELKPLLGEGPLGVFDPANQLKPLLKTNGVEVLDLEDARLAEFAGKLAIIGPFESQAQVREGLANEIKALALKGVVVIWIQPPPGRRERLRPSFHTVLEGKGTVVVVQAALVANLVESPQAQINLIHLSRLALHPEPPRLPP